MDKQAALWSLRGTILFRILELLYGSYIPASVKFGNRPCFPHGPRGIFISGASTIGKNCVLFQHVTIGSNTLIDTKAWGSPTIGDNCYIGAGAKIIGGIRIGNNVRIGANAIVASDIPDNATVVAGREPLISDTPRDNRFFLHSSGKWYFYRDEGLHEASRDDYQKILNRERNAAANSSHRLHQSDMLPTAE